MKKKFTTKRDQKKVRAELQDSSPVVVRFYSTGCPACQASESAWQAFDLPEYRVLSVEEHAIPPEILEKLTAFPTYAKHDLKGSAHVTGAISDTAMIAQKLNVPP